MADASEWEQRRTHFVHNHGFSTHDEMEASIKANNPDLDVDGLDEHIDRAFKDGNYGSMASLLAWVRKDMGL